jgi:DNA-binding HxlR family transcriptional regulator
MIARRIDWRYQKSSEVDVVPAPGKPVRGSRTGKPIMAFLDLAGRRWALRILWEMNAGPTRFRALQAACGASPGVINRRLRELRIWNLVALKEDGYSLTASAKELLVLLLPLNAWCERQAEAGPRRATFRARRYRAASLRNAG